MNAPKRHIAPKGATPRGGKAKSIATSSRHESSSNDATDFVNNVPIIRQADDTKLLPRYSTVLGRTEDDGVNMDDLDQLQLDLEKLISTCAVRNRFLRAEIESIDRVEERRDKKGKSYDKGLLKRKRPDEKSKYRDLKNGTRPIKRHYPLPLNSLIGDNPFKHEIPKINLPKNDTSDKFWATVEPYCAAITNAHAGFLDKLIEECSQDIDVKIPELGDYYANEWNEGATGVEQELGLGGKNVGVDLKKNGLSAMVDTFSNPKTQRLLAALIEEKVMTSFPGVTGKLKPSDLNIIKSSGGPRAAICMDRRLKKDLVEQGILSVEDLSKNLPDDEILQEIKKCQQELLAVNEYNVEELKRLRNIVSKDLRRQEIKTDLDKVDNQVLEVYNKVLLAKQKQIQQAKDDDFDKAAFTKILKEFEAPNWLSELERKREIRLKARLGHEAGAGAPCIKCNDQCPGLDLHFWRKICKNCKCSKEDHDVHDDDIYGWAQFQLLGSKPNKVKKKIVLPGKKDEVELDWAPKGNTETIDRYLKTLALESLPVKGSAAAQNRKQLLQKQIPIHDLDPTLCHELTDSEMVKMQDYIKHMKGSAGVGQIIQFGGINYGHLYHLNEAKTRFINDRLPKTVPSIETVQLLGENKAGGLEKLSLKDQKELDAFFDKIPKPVNMTAHGENLDYNDKSGYVDQIPLNPNKNVQKAVYGHTSSENIPKLTAGNFARQLIDPVQTNEINRNLSADSLNSNCKLGLQGYNPTLINMPESDLVPNQVNIGAIRDITYDSYIPPTDDEGYSTNPPTEIPENKPKQCRKCRKDFAPDEFAIFIEKSNGLYHSDCFKCAGCNQNLADLLYFYDKETDNIYCGRDFAKIKGIPRCKACDELIFVKEYCLAENSTFHLKHFCCFECDEALAGKDYVVEDSQPICVPCFEKVKANKCTSCKRLIRPDEQGLALTEGVHFHAAEGCFCCMVCRKGLLGAKLLFRGGKLYCSHECYRSDQ